MVSWHLYLLRIFPVIYIYCVCVCVWTCCLIVFGTKEQAAKSEQTTTTWKKGIHFLSWSNIYHNPYQHARPKTRTHLRGLNWRGSERSRGGFGSRGRAEPESASEDPEGFRERPGRVEDEEAHGAEGGSKERLSGGLYGAIASFRQWGPGLVDREEWALEDLLWPPWPCPLALAWW